MEMANRQKSRRLGRRRKPKLKSNPNIEQVQPLAGRLDTMRIVSFRSGLRLSCAVAGALAVAGCSSTDRAGDRINPSQPYAFPGQPGAPAGQTVAHGQPATPGTPTLDPRVPTVQPDTTVPGAST